MIEGMRNALPGGALAAALTASLLSAAPVLAEERGTFTAIASMVHDYTTIEHDGGTIIGGASVGTSTVIESSGAPFVAGGHSEVTCVVYAKKSAVGMELDAPCTSTAVSGDKLYTLSERSAGGVEEGSGGDGTLEIMGGTGKYARVTGICTYRTDYLANNRLVTMTECAWRRP